MDVPRKKTIHAERFIYMAVTACDNAGCQPFVTRQDTRLRSDATQCTAKKYMSINRMVKIEFVVPGHQEIGFGSVQAVAYNHGSAALFSCFS